MFNIAVLVSGKGTLLQSLIEELRNTDVNICAVFNSGIDNGAENVAKMNKIPLHNISGHTYTEEGRCQILFNVINIYKVDLIVCAGYIKKLIVPPKFNRKIINCHPSLLPDFGGKGMYGDNVYKKILESPFKVTGITIHYVNNEYDQGEMIYQEAIEILENDTVESLKARVQQLERKVYPNIIQLLLERNK